jgi:hypothetical protein
MARLADKCIGNGMGLLFAGEDYKELGVEFEKFKERVE